MVEFFVVDNTCIIAFVHKMMPLAPGWKFPTILYGAILHGHFAAAYIFPAHLPGGTNVTIEVIHRFSILICYTHLSSQMIQI